MEPSSKVNGGRVHRRPLFWAGRALRILFLAYLAVLILVWLGQDRLIFHPRKELKATPAAYNLNYEAVWLTTEDGLKIQSWFIPAPNARDRGQTILFLPGNAENMATQLDRVELMHHEGFAVMMVDYRGYGQSEGRPSEEGLYLDSRAAWKWLTEIKKTPPGRIIIWGYSLGGGVASWLAVQEPAAGGLALESTFTSVTDVAGYHCPWLPVRLIMGQRFDTLGRGPEIKMPLLVIHSPEDLVVPYQFGRRVFESYQGPKKFVELHGDHREAFSHHHGQPYRQAMDQFGQSLPGSGGPAEGPVKGLEAEAER